MVKDLISAIKEKQALLAKLQAELDEAKALLESGVQETHVTLRRGTSTQRPKGSRRLAAKPQKTGSIIKAKSSVGRARAILRKVGEPLHLDDIFSRINKGRKKVKRSTLVGNLSRYVKMGVVFSRTAPNTFGLLEWQKVAGEKETPKRTPVRPEAA